MDIDHGDNIFLLCVITFDGTTKIPMLSTFLVGIFGRISNQLKYGDLLLLFFLTKLIQY